MKRIRLFCLAYAGGSATIYLDWKKNLGDSIELYPIELSGRGKRTKNKLCQSITEIVEDIYTLVEDSLDEMPYAILGYSMGSLVAYELAYKIMQSEHRKPIHMFFCAREAPSVIKKDRVTLHNLSDKEFKNEIASLGGTPTEILKDDEIFNYFIPVLRADYKAIETYEYREKKDKLDCDISVLYGSDDTITLEEVEEWKSHTYGNTNIYRFNSGHFFINGYSEKMVKIILKDLNCS